jgi:hypothetical protein
MKVPTTPGFDDESVARMLGQLFADFSRNVGQVRIKDMSTPATPFDTARVERAMAKRARRAAKRTAKGKMTA